MITTLDILIKAQKQEALKQGILEASYAPQKTVLEDGIHRLVFHPEQQELIIEWSGQDGFGSHKLAPARLSYQGLRRFLAGDWTGLEEDFKLLI